MKCARERTNARLHRVWTNCVLNSYFDPIRLGLPCDSHAAAFVWSRNLIVARGVTRPFVILDDFASDTFATVRHYKRRETWTKFVHDYFTLKFTRRRMSKLHTSFAQLESSISLNVETLYELAREQIVNRIARGNFFWVTDKKKYQ